MGYLKKIRDFFKYSVTPFLQNFKRLQIIVLGYNLCICFVYFVLRNCEFSLDVFIRMYMLFMIFYIVWGISTVIMYAQYVERPESIFKGKHWLKPGRYIFWDFGGIVLGREMRTSPVDDYYYVVMVMLLLVFPMSFIQLLIHRQVDTLSFIHIINAGCLGILREAQRLEDDYVKNMEKAKVIYFKNQGCEDILKYDEDYQRYQVSLAYEKAWKKELEESSSQNNL